MTIAINFLLYFLLLAGYNVDKRKELPEVTVSAEEIELYNLINEYRRTKKLPAIPLSKSLTYVAQQHAKDLSLNRPHMKNGCNAHSWSSKGSWTSCCYSNDHKQAKCMWDKPREMTNYKDDGFEIAYESTALSAESAIAGWKLSEFHNAVIVNEKPWNAVEWNAIGVGIYEGVATVWFGRGVDPDGEPTIAQ